MSQKTFRVEFEHNGAQGVHGTGHTWIDARDENDAMATVEILRPGVQSLAAIERVIDSCSCSRGGSAIFCECQSTAVKVKSQASKWADHLRLQGATNESLPILGIIPAPSTVSHSNYSVAYYDDHSILIWAKGEGFVVLDEEQTYYRDTVEHLARCLGLFSKVRRAEMISKKAAGDDSVWIDGIRWGSDGSYLGM